jgi:cytosol alanyl aminopeptidase
VALGQPLTLMRPGEEALSRRQAYVTVASHELAHFWFGDLVTLKWWDDTWLNEAFAQWMDAKITDAVEPSWGVLRSERLARAAEAMHADGRATAKRMRQPITSVEDILHAFDGNLTYQKGASIITMMEHAVGPEKWRAAMRRYMERFAGKTVSAGDLLGVLAETLGGEAAAAFESFLNQPGVPLVTAERDCGPWPPRIKLSQKRYLPLGSAAPRAVWNMPVCVRYGAAGKQGRFCTFLAEESKTVPLPDLKECPEWIVPNEEGAGYHVSGYREEQIDRLTGGGKGKPQLSAAERAAMVRDVGLLVASGEMPLGKALGLIPDAVAAGDKATLVAAQSIFRNIRSSELPEPLFKKLQAFARKTFSGRAKALGFSPAPDEAPGTVEMREMLLYAAGLGGEDPEILGKARDLAQRWLGDEKVLSPDLAAVTLALAARTNDAGLFDKIVTAAKGTARRSDKELLLRALGHVTDRALAERALGLVLSKDFDLRESLPVAGGLLAGRRTRDLAYDWLKRNFDEILRRSSTFERPFFFMLPEVYCDAAHRAEVDAFFGPRARTVEGAQPRLAGTLEAISVCEASHKAALPGLEAFLKRY